MVSVKRSSTHLLCIPDMCLRWGVAMGEAAPLWFVLCGGVGDRREFRRVLVFCFEFQCVLCFRRVLCCRL